MISAPLVATISNLNSGADQVNYFRNALGRVVAEIVGSETVFRLYDGTLPIVEMIGTDRKEFTPGRLPNDLLFAALDGENYWLTYDGLMSIRLLTNASGSIISIPSFRPFGASEDGELALSPLRIGFASMW